MADRTRLAAAGLFLALTLAAVPALLPVDLAGAGGRPQVEAAAPVPALVHLRGGSLTPPTIQPKHAAVPTVSPAAVSEAASSSHTIAPGDTLWKISQDAGIGVEALAAANHLTPAVTLHTGQVLLVPSGDAAFPKSTASRHEVAPGETLWAISRASGLRVETLAAANNISLDAVLRPGQMLIVPSPSDRGTARSARVRGSLAPDPQAEVPGELFADTFGDLAQPSEGMITSRFGWRVHPIFGTREFHTGLDIANRVGTPVRAAEGGIVRFVGWMGGYGRLIVLTHANGLETSYSHLSAMLVRLGQRVARGEVVGRMGSTGWSTGPHLFFEVRRNGVALDPVPFLQRKGGATAVASTPQPPRSAPASVPETQTTAEEHRSTESLADNASVH